MMVAQLLRNAPTASPSGRGSEGGVTTTWF
jgi:hypothetical protein